MKIALGVLACGILLYFGLHAILAYTEDAYVRSDFVEVAPEVSGPVVSVNVTDNQKVAAGDLLAQIDPQPFQLRVDLKNREVAEARAAIGVKQASGLSLGANVDSARAALTLATQEYNRIFSLVRSDDLSQATLDKATDDRKAAQDALADAEGRMRENAQDVAVAQAQVATAEADLALAQYSLSRTRIVAPVAGYVTNLGLRPGAYASEGKPLVGLVDDGNWRVIANFKEDVAANLPEGLTVWVWLETRPWTLYRGHVVGTGRGIARAQQPDRLLPYVAPTTDWIHLARRLPVTIHLDTRPDALYMGADARVFLWR
ncbi:HlyD family secretion protein [Roseixanthobacter liquoris]|uniref:HlyD family secretion protein n=1 Tax=Roseixanthobacter liquoris TaxID=3119921 RepID=UPI0037266ED5